MAACTHSDVHVITRQRFTPYLTDSPNNPNILSSTNNDNIPKQTGTEVPGEAVLEVLEEEEEWEYPPLRDYCCLFFAMSKTKYAMLVLVFM